MSDNAKHQILVTAFAFAIGAFCYAMEVCA